MDLEKLLTYFNHPKVKETYKNYKSLQVNDYPELNYFGINFDEKGICSVKFYFAFFRRLQKHEVELFLPHTKDFDAYYHLWQESKQRSFEHTGCTFEVKFKGDDFPVTGFHFRIHPTEESYNLIGYPQQLPFNIKDVSTRPGINYEYEKNGVLRKKYYYFENENHKKVIAERFKKPFAEKASLIEYTETEKFSKVNLWRFDYSPENRKRPNYFTKENNNLIDELEKKYGLINVSDGFYENDTIKATYFFNTNNNSPAAFDDLSNYNIDTLKLFI